MRAKELHGIQRKTAAICDSVLHSLLGEAQRLEIWPQHGSAPKKKTELPDAIYSPDCSAYCAIRSRFTNIFWGPAPTLSSFFTLHDPKVIARFLGESFEHRNTLVAAQSGHTL